MTGRRIATPGVVVGQERIFGFDDVPATAFAFGVGVVGQERIFGFDSVSADGFTFGYEEGGAVIFGFEEVVDTGFVFGYAEGENVVFGFDDVEAGGFTFAATPNANTRTFTLDDVTVTGFAFGYTEGEAFNQRRWRLSDLTEVGGATALTNVNSVTFVSGKVGNCANFVAASSQRLEVSDAIFNGVSEAFTIWGWFKLTTTGVNHGIAGQNTSSYHCHVISSNKLRLRVNRATAGNRVVDSAETLVADTWYFYVAEYDPANNLMRVELNRGTPTTNTIDDGTGLVSGTGAFTIGSIGAGNYCNGQIDQVGFRRGALLSSGEKDAFYAAGAGADF